jgi:hypothetical protein
MEELIELQELALLLKEQLVEGQRLALEDRAQAIQLLICQFDSARPSCSLDALGRSACLQLDHTV